MLELKKIYKSYRAEEIEQSVLENVSLAFRERELAVILGPAGAGKTTLLRLIAGLERIDYGEIRINRETMGEPARREWDARRKYDISYISQESALLEELTVLENVELALHLMGVAEREIRERAVRSLGKTGLKRQMHRKPSELSTGQRKKAEVARALAKDSGIILADEPTGMLDIDSSYQIMELLKEAAKTRLVIVVTHQSELAEIYATRIIRMIAGSVLDDSMPFSGGRESREKGGRTAVLRKKEKGSVIRSRYLFRINKDTALQISLWTMGIAGISAASVLGDILYTAIMSVLLTGMLGASAYLLQMKRKKDTWIMRSLGASVRETALRTVCDAVCTGIGAALCGGMLGMALSAALSGTAAAVYACVSAGIGFVLHVILNLWFSRKDRGVL